MARVDIDIGTQGDVTGLKQIETGYQNLLTKSQQAYRSMMGSSPMDIAADKSSHERKMSELDLKARDIDRKMMQVKLGISEGATAPATGKDRMQELQTQALRVNYEKSVMQEEQRVIAQGREKRMGAIAPYARAGRFAVGKTLKYGGLIAGGLGAYSLFSNIFGEMAGAEERNMAYAMALSTTRGRRDEQRYKGVIPQEEQHLYYGGRTDYGGKTRIDYDDVVKPFFQVKEALKSIGETAYITAKDMAPMLEVVKEIGDVSGGRKGTAGARLAQITNIGKLLGVESPVLSQFLTQGIRGGGFTGDIQGTDMAKVMMLNQNMMHRATESLQAMQQVMVGTTHGVQGLGAFNMLNLMDTLNSSQFRAYRGMGGANMMMRVDQAFRGGGNENFQYMQTLALNPSFQVQNARRLAAFKDAQEGAPTNYGTGRYDQFIADIFKDLGAFATPQDVIKMLGGEKVDGKYVGGLGFGGAARYVEEKYGASLNKTNIERTFDQYRLAFNAKDEGQKLFMTAQIAKDMDIKFADVGVLSKAFENEEFMKRARKGGFAPGEVAGIYERFKKEGMTMPELDEFLEGKAEAKRIAVETATKLQAAKDILVRKLVEGGGMEAIITIAGALPKLVEAINSFVNIFKTTGPTGPTITVPSPLGDIEIPETAKKRNIIDAMAGVWPKIGELRDKYNMVDKVMTALATSVFPNLLPNPTSAKPLQTPVIPLAASVEQMVKSIIDKALSYFTEVGAEKNSPEAKAAISQAIKEGFANINVTIPANSGQTVIKDN